MYTNEQLVAIATEFIEGKVQVGEGSTLVVEDLGDALVVEWQTDLGPHTRGPDYDARLTLDRESGEVTEFLVGS